jgi:hypothetical protein
LLLKAPNSVILKEEHRIRGKNGYENIFGPFSGLRRWRKLPHEKTPHSSSLTYKVKAITSIRIRLLSLFRALSQHCPTE